MDFRTVKVELVLDNDPDDADTPAALPAVNLSRHSGLCKPKVQTQFQDTRKQLCKDVEQMVSPVKSGFRRMLLDSVVSYSDFAESVGRE